MINITRMKSILKEIYPLIIKGEDHMWAPYIRRWYTELEPFPEETIRQMIECSRGRDSLADTHITQDSISLKPEDKQFRALHNELYQLCMDALPDISRRKDKPTIDPS